MNTLTQINALTCLTGIGAMCTLHIFMERNYGILVNLWWPESISKYLDQFNAITSHTDS